MFKKFIGTLNPVLKWVTVIATTAVVVISIQVIADGHGYSDREADLTQPNEGEQSALLQLVDAVPGRLNNEDARAWSPASGFAGLIKAVSPAVVHVAISGKVKPRAHQRRFRSPPGSPFEDFFERFGPQQNEERSRPLGIGSGFVISEDGYVVTNNHVIQNADEITVTLAEGKEYNAVLVGNDSKTDLALLKLDDASDLDYVVWGTEEASEVGDWVVAIGNPFGLGGSASAGIISAFGRDIRSGPYDDYIQVDAAINRGNSGGPLFNMKGEVIGINTAIYSPNGGSVGIGFSIPSSIAKNVISQLRESGQVERGWIGVEIQALTDELAEGFERDNNAGALVSNVVPSGPADKAGLRAGDIILKFNSKDVEKMRDLPRIVAESIVGREYKLAVWRDGKLKTLSIRTERFPEDPSEVASSTPSDKNSNDDNLFGANLAEISDELRAQHSLSDEVEGVIVLGVERGGLAARNGLRRGDIIVSVDKRLVRTPKAVTEGVRAAKKAGRAKIVILVQRGNGGRFVPFDLSDKD